MNTRSPFRQPIAIAAVGLCGLFVLAAASSRGHAVEQENAANPRNGEVKIARLVDEQTIVVAKVDLARTRLPEPNEVLQRLQAAGMPGLADPRIPEAEEGWRLVIQQADEWLESLRAAAGDRSIYMTIALPRSRTDRPISLMTDASDDLDREAFLERLGGFFPDATLREHEGMVVLGRGDQTRRADDTDTRPLRPELEQASRAVARFPIQVLLLPPEHLRRTVRELVPRVPEAWGGGPSEMWVEGVRWAAFGFDPADMEAELVVASASGQAAERWGEHVEALLRSPEKLTPELGEHVPLEKFVEALRSQIDVERHDARWVARMEGEGAYVLGAKLLIAATSGVQQHMGSTDDMNKFKQILLAMHNYHDVYNALPPPEQGRDEEGRAKLSWRVYLLPFLGEAELYHQFRLDEPWDSEHNKPLVDQMPQVYSSRQSGTPRGHTTFLAPVGEDTVFGGTEPTRFQYIRDGLSNTAAVVEVESQRAVPWTAPDDYAFDPEAPGAGLHAAPDDSFLVALMDGSVHRLRKDAPAEMLRRLFQKSDEKAVDWDGLR